jgi:hypothetical protein
VLCHHLKTSLISVRTSCSFTFSARWLVKQLSVASKAFSYLNTRKLIRPEIFAFSLSTLVLFAL